MDRYKRIMLMNVLIKGFLIKYHSIEKERPDITLDIFVTEVLKCNLEDVFCMVETSEVCAKGKVPLPWEDGYVAGLANLIAEIPKRMLDDFKIPTKLTTKNIKEVLGVEPRDVFNRIDLRVKLNSLSLETIYTAKPISVEDMNSLSKSAGVVWDIVREKGKPVGYEIFYENLQQAREIDRLLIEGDWMLEKGVYFGKFGKEEV